MGYWELADLATRIEDVLFGTSCDGSDGVELVPFVFGGGGRGRGALFFFFLNVPPPPDFSPLPHPAPLPSCAVPDPAAAARRGRAPTPPPPPRRPPRDPRQSRHVDVSPPLHRALAPGVECPDSCRTRTGNPNHHHCHTRNWRHSAKSCGGSGRSAASRSRRSPTRRRSASGSSRPSSATTTGH